MYIPKKLKLNQYRVCQIPSARDIIQRFGLNPGSQYSGDTEVPPTMSKLDFAASVDYNNERQLRQEQINSDYEANKDKLI